MSSASAREAGPRQPVAPALARSLLFVPGTRPDRFAKAATSGADGIVLDLEDAVTPADKEVAREAVAGWLADGGTGIVRINGVDAPWHGDDLAALGHAPVGVMLPKATAEHARAVLDRLSAGSYVIALVESAVGILDAPTVCSVSGVVRAAFGNVDLGAELGVDHADTTALAHARSRLVLASAAAGIAPPLDGVTTALDDIDRLAADTRHASSMGFTGKLCIHPRQVESVHVGFAPTAAEVEWAERVVAHAAGAAETVGGHMIDKPVVLRAQALLVRARRP